MKSKIVSISSIVSVLVLGGACASSGEASGESASLSQSEKSAQTARSDAPRRVEVEVGASGYDPARIETEAGNPLTLVFERVTDEGCGDKLVVASRGIERELPLNQPVEVSMAPEQPGTIDFTCGMGMYEGAIVVR